jgi:hypothetical protein
VAKFSNLCVGELAFAEAIFCWVMPNFHAVDDGREVCEVCDYGGLVAHGGEKLGWEVGRRKIIFISFVRHSLKIKAPCSMGESLIISMSANSGNTYQLIQTAP